MKNRQIHLDFHTNGLIENIGGKFDAERFARTLKDAHVGEVCLFARCHHGWCYYPTKNGTTHPHLKEPDLLGKQIKACRDAGIETSIYTTICWDELASKEHPDWICRNSENQFIKINPHTGEQMSKFQPGWHLLCINTGYRDYFKEHLKDLLGIHMAEHLFLDIIPNSGCMCDSCVELMRKRNLNPEKAWDCEKNSIESAREFMAEINEIIYSINPKIKPFYNSRLRVTGIVEDGSRPEMDYLGYLAIESLPSGPWGYDHFPIFVKYFQNFASDQKQIMGHTGKFQKMWGDFGGLKNQAALDYEVMRMLANGVAASVGDQLHPEGMLDKPTYELIAKTFKKVKDFEKYLLPSKPIDEIGVLLTNKPKLARNFGTELDAETGAMKLLTQLQYQFSFIDQKSDFSKYKLLILPDEVVLNDGLKNKIEEYLLNGGKILASYNSGSNPEKQWSIKDIDINIKGDYPFNPYYVYPANELLEYNIIAETDHIFYLGGKEIETDQNYKVFAKITDPYFNRTWEHFCSHAQTPPAKRTQNPEMIYNGRNIIYFSSPVFTCYHQYSPKAIKQMADFGLKKLLGEKILESNLPSTAEVTYRENSLGQKVVSVLNYIPQRRTDSIDIIEESIKLTDINMSISSDTGPKKIFERTTGKELNFEIRENKIQLKIPQIDGLAVITIE